MIRLVSQKSKFNHNFKNSIPSKIFKQKRLTLNSYSKGFSKFRINVSGGAHLHKSCRSQAFNFTKDRLHLAVPLGILKIFKTAIWWTHAASYCHYYVILRSFLLVTRVFNFYLFRWQHWQITSNRLLIMFHQIHLLLAIFCANANYIFLNWCYMIYTCLLYSKISMGEVTFLLASSFR